MNNIKSGQDNQNEHIRKKRNKNKDIDTMKFESEEQIESDYTINKDNSNSDDDDDYNEKKKKKVKKKKKGSSRSRSKSSRSPSPSIITKEKKEKQQRRNKQNNSQSLNQFDESSNSIKQNIEQLNQLNETEKENTETLPQRRNFDDIQLQQDNKINQYEQNVQENENEWDNEEELKIIREMEKDDNKFILKYNSEDPFIILNKKKRQREQEQYENIEEDGKGQKRYQIDFENQSEEQENCNEQRSEMIKDEQRNQVNSKQQTSILSEAIKQNYSSSSFSLSQRLQSQSPVKQITSIGSLFAKLKQSTIQTPHDQSSSFIQIDSTSSPIDNRKVMKKILINEDIKENETNENVKFENFESVQQFDQKESYSDINSQNNKQGQEYLQASNTSQSSSSSPQLQPFVIDCILEAIQKTIHAIAKLAHLAPYQLGFNIQAQREMIEKDTRDKNSWLELEGATISRWNLFGAVLVYFYCQMRLKTEEIINKFIFQSDQRSDEQIENTDDYGQNYIGTQRVSLRTPHKIIPIQGRFSSKHFVTPLIKGNHSDHDKQKPNLTMADPVNAQKHNISPNIRVQQQGQLSFKTPQQRELVAQLRIALAPYSPPKDEELTQYRTLLNLGPWQNSIITTFQPNTQIARTAPNQLQSLQQPSILSPINTLQFLAPHKPNPFNHGGGI